MRLVVIVDKTMFGIRIGTLVDEVPSAMFSGLLFSVNPAEREFLLTCGQLRLPPKTNPLLSV